MIFVQIASYRDIELEWTLRGCLARARHPRNIKFAIVAQTATGEPPPDLSEIPGVQMVSLVPEVGQGVGYVRGLANSMYRGEDYYLQIDSHTRFDWDWDVILINQIETSTVSRPVISAYPPMYWYPDNDVREDSAEFGGNNSTIVITATGWHKSKMLLLEPRVLINRCQTPGFALAGGFIFTTGDFARIVPVDTHIMFVGEEITLSAQAYTRGYDILSPSTLPLYHHYTRTNFRKPWTDNVERCHKNSESESRVAGIFQSGGPAGYFGTTRTFTDFQVYCGIDFQEFTITPNSVNQALVQHTRPF